MQETQEMRVQSLGWEDPLEKEMATHSSTLAWRIPWREEPGRLQSMGSQRVRHFWATSLSLSQYIRNWISTTKADSLPLHHVGSLRWKWKKVKVKSVSHVQLCATPWTVAHQAPPSLGFSRQEHWSGLPFPSPGDFPNPGIKLMSPALAGGFFTTEPPDKWKWKQVSPWNSLGPSTGVGRLSLLQGMFPTQGSNPGLPHCRWILYQLSHQFLISVSNY